MDDTHIFMDNMYINKFLRKESFSSHTGAFKRQFSVLPALDAIGYIPKKSHWIDCEFSTWNFSIILSGNGIYFADGKEYKVVSPCVLTQRPGIHVKYGPDSSWEELFFIYDKDAAETLQRGNVFPKSEASPIWYFTSIARTISAIRLLVKSLELLQYQKYAGDVDLLAYETIITTFNHPFKDRNSLHAGSDLTKICAVETLLQTNPAGKYDFALIAKENGMHYAKFRRLWNTLVEEPPNRYLQKLRLMHAAKILAETTLQIQEVADVAGFIDALYFSRLFKREFGISPKFYREKYADSLLNKLPE
ncbi:MAG: helix-turn-helix transcriptional regulator [Spirochaetia bacterium]|nr:helix-turn-helix transcriptional regulator [Spirochaetia bacterium]